jgi:hypothetical protein
MTSTALPTHPARGHPVAAPPVRRRRSSRLLLLGVVLAVLGALLGVLLLQMTAQRESVIAVAATVPFGQAISRENLREVAVSVDNGLTTIPWSDVDSVVGQIAATDLLAGSTLTPDGMSPGGPPAAGDAVVGVAVGPGRLPVTPLHVRDEVLVVEVDGVGAPLRATVLRMGEPDIVGKRTVDLLVNESVGVELARIAAADRAVLVHVARR